MCGQSAMVVVVAAVALAQPTAATIRTECGTYNQSSEIPQPLEMNKIGEGVLEARFQLLPPLDNTTWAEVVHIMNQKDNHTLARLQIDHIPGHQYQFNLKCSATTDDDPSLMTTETGPDAITNLTLQDFIQLRVGCFNLTYDSHRKYTYPLPFRRFEWERQPEHLQRQGGECWMELSTITDVENQMLLGHNCPFSLQEFPQLQLAVRCLDDVEHCATIIFCNTECEAVARSPVHCNELTVPHLDGYREPLRHQSTCQDKAMEVLEVELVLTPPPGTQYSSLRLELGTSDYNNTPLGWIDFERSTLSPFFRSQFSVITVDERLRFMCLQDYVGRVTTPWDVTSHIDILIQITNSSMNVYQQLEGKPRLVAEHRCPLGVRSFPHQTIEVWCRDGNDCGEVLSPTIPGYTKIPSSAREALKIDVNGGEVQETRLVFKTPLPDQHWSIWLQYDNDDGLTDAGVKISNTPNNSMGEHLWLQTECEWDPPDSSNFVSLNNGILPSTAPPRSYLLQVGIDWMRVTETTPGLDQTVHQYNCSRPLPRHPTKVTLTVACYSPGYRDTYDCGKVSQLCPTEVEQDEDLPQAKKTCMLWWREEDLSVRRYGIEMAVVMLFFTGVVTVILFFSWILYVNIDIGHSLAPLLTLCWCVKHLVTPPLPPNQ